MPNQNSVWPDLAKFRHFGKSIQVFGQICDIIGLIIIVANGQILKNNLTTWSRCQTVPNVEKGMWFKIFSQIYISFFEHVVRRCQVKKIYPHKF